MPSEDSKPPYDKSLTDLAENEIEGALEALGYGYVSSNPQYNAERFRARMELLKKQAAAYAYESDRYLWHLCVPDESYLTSSDSGLICEKEQARFQRNYGLALNGDYEAQQKVAECFFPKACAGAVTTNETLACAWMMVSLASGDKRIKKSEIDDYQIDCVRKRAPAETAVIRTRAERLFETIYHKPLPHGF